MFLKKLKGVYSFCTFLFTGKSCVDRSPKNKVEICWAQWYNFERTHELREGMIFDPVKGVILDF